jgi:hypothetical protein
MPYESGASDVAAGRPRRRDWPGMIAAVVFILLGLWVLQQSRSMTAMGSVFPTAIAIAMIVFSIALLITNLRPRKSVRDGATVPEEAIRPGTAESTPRRLALVGILVAWALLLPVIGFLVTSLVAFLAILVTANYDSWTARRAIGFIAGSVVVVAAFYLLLVEVLQVPMPAGLLF